MFKGDVYEAQDRTRAAQENKADRDAFWSNLGAGLQNLSGTAQKMGAAYNQRLLNAQGVTSLDSLFGQYKLQQEGNIFDVVYDSDEAKASGLEWSEELNKFVIKK